MPTILAILSGLLAGGVIAGLVLEDLLLRRLRAPHRELWQRLGSPDRVFDDGGLAGRGAIRRLYREPELRQRCSPEVLAMVKRARAQGRALVLLAIATFAILMVWLARTR